MNINSWSWNELSVGNRLSTSDMYLILRFIDDTIDVMIKDITNDPRAGVRRFLSSIEHVVSLASETIQLLYPLEHRSTWFIEQKKIQIEIIDGESIYTKTYDVSGFYMSYSAIPVVELND